jgi:metabolite-proton symporter
MIGNSAPAYEATPVDTDKKTGRGKLTAASMVGTTLEWYDFTIYNTLAALVFGKLFFPSVDPLAGIALAFSTYAVGYVSRPLGGLVLGHLGDRLGRRAVLVITLILMGITTGVMGLLPTYAAIGMWSPVLLVSLRFMQGVALGGEWAGAVLISVEHGDQSKRGLNASWTQMGPGLGMLTATGVIAATTALLSPADFLDWGWRIPFPLSLLIVVFGLWVRRDVKETPMFDELSKSESRAKTPVAEVFRHHWRRLLVAGGARMGVGVLYALVVVFTLTYVTTKLNLPRGLALVAIMIGTACNAISVPLFGALSDRIGRRPVYAGGAIAAMVWSFVFFRLLDSSHPVLIVLAVIVGLVIHASMYGPQAAFVTEQFPTRVRYAGTSVAYTLSGVVSDGFAPLIIVSLFRATQGTGAISLYVCITMAITLVALLFARETAKLPLEN